jgi:S-methylmethionine-dependent homocysteine/selenocysteine methylase
VESGLCPNRTCPISTTPEFHVLDHRRGDTGLPLWSANALTSDIGLNTLRQIHLDYLNGGADILTANTFRTHRRVLATRIDPAR